MKRKQKEEKIVLSNGFYVKAGIHKFLRRTIEKSKNKINKLNQLLREKIDILMLYC